MQGEVSPGGRSAGGPGGQPGLFLVKPRAAIHPGSSRQEQGVRVRACGRKKGPDPAIVFRVPVKKICAFIEKQMESTIFDNCIFAGYYQIVCIPPGIGKQFEIVNNVQKRVLSDLYKV